MKKVRKIVYWGGQLSKKIIPIVIVLLVFTLTITYAYFTAQNDIGKLEDNALEQQTATLNGTEVTLAGETLKAEGTNVYPGHKEIVKLTVSALHDNGPVNYNLEWVGQNSLTSKVTYKIYKSESNLTPEITCNTVSEGGIEEIHYYEECNITGLETLEASKAYQEGIIVQVAETTTQGLLYNEEITGNEDPKKVYYYVVIEYPNDPDNPQDIDAEYGYNGHFKLNIGSEYDPLASIIAQVKTDKPNFGKGSCLNGTNNEAHNEGNCGEETNGLYKETTTLGDTYYYRGTINNNWVKFGKTGVIKGEGTDIWWRIVRINEDKTIRLIYAGEGEEAPASTDQVGGQGGYWMSNNYGINNTRYAFNNSTNSNAYVGYMYGTANSETFNAEHGYDLINAGDADQLQDSSIKTVIDDWYGKNLQDEGSVLSGSTGFCGDRTPAEYKPEGYTNNGYGEEKTYYKAYDRNIEKLLPSFECEDSAHDLYTTSSEQGDGNGALDFPIGLITIDEAAYAGTSWGSVNNYGFWLQTGKYYWTLSPYYFGGSASEFRLYSNGNLTRDDVNATLGVRPTINVYSEYLNTNGKDGTIENPYVVEV